MNKGEPKVKSGTSLSKLADNLKPIWTGGDKLPEGLTPELFRRLLEGAIDVASYKDELYFHYGNYNVGSSGLGVVTGFDHLELVTARNRKHSAGKCKNKSCAEAEATRRAQIQKIEWFKYFMLIAPMHADDATGINWDYLVPCGQCRNDHWNLSGTFREDTIIFLAHPQYENTGLPIIAYRFGELIRHLGHYEGYWHS